MDSGYNLNRKMFYFNTNDDFSVYEFSRTLYNMMDKSIYENRPIVILCIGSDRATGDSLGPLVGYKLEKLKHSNITLYGTLEHPIHAKNLKETIANIQISYDNPFVIAIDASLGRTKHVGFITLLEGPLFPGAGVDKNLPPVGDISITGIVNHSSSLDHLLLQTTRLNVVMELADFICSGMNYCFYKLKRKKVAVTV